MGKVTPKKPIFGKKPILSLRRQPSRYTPVDAGEPSRSWVDVHELAGRYTAVAFTILMLIWGATRIYWYWEISRDREQEYVRGLHEYGSYYSDMRRLMADVHSEWRPQTGVQPARPANEEPYSQQTLDHAMATLRASSANSPLLQTSAAGSIVTYRDGLRHVADLIVLKEQSQRARTVLLNEIALQSRRPNDPGYAWGLVAVMATGGCGGYDECRDAVETYISLYRAYATYPAIADQVRLVLAAYPLTGKPDAIVKETLRLADEKGATAAAEYFRGKMVAKPGR